MSRRRIMAKMAVGRILYARGPDEFDKFRFAPKPPREWRQYVDDKARKRMQERMAPIEHRRFDEDKLEFCSRCLADSLPTVPVLAAIRSSRHITVPAGIPVADSAGELAEILGSAGPLDGFAKPIDAGRGYGAFVFQYSQQVVSGPFGNGDASILFDYCQSQPFSKRGYLLQPRLDPHPELACIMPGPGIGVVRIVTFLYRDGSVRMPWAVIRAPRRGEVIDKLRTGTLLSAVDITTGRLLPAVGRTESVPVYHEIANHPDTGQRLTDVVVPRWGEVVELVERAARAFSFMPCLGWDVAVTPTGPVLVETNWEFGTESQQIVLNRGLARELRHHISSCIPA